MHVPCYLPFVALLFFRSLTLMLSLSCCVSSLLRLLLPYIVLLLPLFLSLLLLMRLFSTIFLKVVFSLHFGNPCLIASRNFLYCRAFLLDILLRFTRFNFAISSVTVSVTFCSCWSRIFCSRIEFSYHPLQYSYCHLLLLLFHLYSRSRFRGFCRFHVSSYYLPCSIRLLSTVFWLSLSSCSSFSLNPTLWIFFRSCFPCMCYCSFSRYRFSLSSPLSWSWTLVRTVLTLSYLWNWTVAVPSFSCVLSCPNLYFSSFLSFTIYLSPLLSYRRCHSVLTLAFLSTIVLICLACFLYLTISFLIYCFIPFVCTTLCFLPVLLSRT